MITPFNHLFSVYNASLLDGLPADEVVLGVTTGGWVKVWTVSEREVKPREPIFEHESKMIHSLNALCLVCCTYNQRTVLIVSQDDWQVST